jgi:protein-S-isoprenylcysteine O-methyltransferase Ste14
MTGPAFQAWEHEVVAGGTCTPASPVASQVGTTSYNYTVPIPATGVYDLVVNNLSTSTVVVQVNANLSAAAPTLVTVVAYSTVTQQMVQTLMQTSVATMQPTSSGPDPTTVAAIILVIVIIAAVAYVAMRKRGKTK